MYLMYYKYDYKNTSYRAVYQVTNNN